MSERFITSVLNKKDFARETTLRPVKFCDFPGQDNIKEQLELFVLAAKERNEPLDHILLSGPPGLGKTTLAYIIANERDCNIKSSSGPAIEKPGDLAGLLTSLQEGDILFVTGDFGYVWDDGFRERKFLFWRQGKRRPPTSSIAIAPSVERWSSQRQ